MIVRTNYVICHIALAWNVYIWNPCVRVKFSIQKEVSPIESARIRGNGWVEVGGYGYEIRG